MQFVNGITAASIKLNALDKHYISKGGNRAEAFERRPLSVDQLFAETPTAWWFDRWIVWHCVTVGFEQFEKMLI
jgi:hypothetical protein